MNRAEFFREGLPLIAATIRARKTRATHVLVGPSEAEIGEYAPSLAEHLSCAGQSRVIPTIDGQSLFDTLIEDAQARLVDLAFTELGPDGGMQAVSVIAIPPMTKFDMTGLGEATQIFLSADPGLLFSALQPDCGFWYEPLLLTVAQAMIDTDSRDLRRTLADRSVHERTPSRLAIMRSVRRALRENVPDLADPIRSSRIKEWVEATLASGRVNPRIPTLMWLFEVQPPQQLILTSLRSPQTHDLVGVHSRVASAAATDRFRSDIDFARHYCAVAEGNGARQEDDAFVPITELLLSSDWAPVTRSNTLLSRTAEAVGHPLVELGDIAKIGVSNPDGVSPCVWIKRTGQDAGAVVAKRPEQLSDWICVENEDPDMLARSLNDHTAQDAIRCGGYGSFRSPVLNDVSLAGVPVIWPAADARARMKLEVAFHTEQLDDLEGGIEEIQESVMDLRRGAEEHSPWEIERRHAAMVESVRCYLPQLETPWCGGTKLPSGSTWPALIAIIKRRLENEENAIVRLFRTMDLADAVMRCDAIVSAALLHFVDHQRFGQVIRKVRGEPVRRDWFLPHGHWKNLQNEARRVIEEIDGHAVPAIRAYPKTSRMSKMAQLR